MTRVMPCADVPTMPAGRTHIRRDLKERVDPHVKTLRLLFTIVDVGQRDQLSISKLPSGKTDPSVLTGESEMAGEGVASSTLTDVRDIGRYVARVAVDVRAENRYVLVYDEIWTPNEVYELVVRESGEKIERKYVSKEELEERVASVPERSMEFGALMVKAPAQYLLSWGVRGDNTPECAKYLECLTNKDLYPEMDFTGWFDAYVTEVLAGEAPTVYEGLRNRFAAQSEWHIWR